MSLILINIAKHRHQSVYIFAINIYSPEELHKHSPIHSRFAQRTLFITQRARVQHTYMQHK